MPSLTLTSMFSSAASKEQLLTFNSFGRYYGNIITDTSGFQTFWKTLASKFAGNSRVVSVLRIKDIYYLLIVHQDL